MLHKNSNLNQNNSSNINRQRETKSLSTRDIQSWTRPTCTRDQLKLSKDWASTSLKDLCMLLTQSSKYIISHPTDTICTSKTIFNSQPKTTVPWIKSTMLVRPLGTTCTKLIDLKVKLRKIRDSSTLKSQETSELNRILKKGWYDLEISLCLEIKF